MSATEDAKNCYPHHLLPILSFLIPANPRCFFHYLQHHATFLSTCNTYILNSIPATSFFFLTTFNTVILHSTNVNTCNITLRFSSKPATSHTKFTTCNIALLFTLPGTPLFFLQYLQYHCTVLLICNTAIIPLIPPTYSSFLNTCNTALFPSLPATSSCFPK